VAIQSCWPFVGAGCPWVESGVGAVATQSFTEVAHGPNGLARLRAGEAAAEALASLKATDPGEAVRQVGIVDAAGRAAAHTGARCVEAAGHLTSGDHPDPLDELERLVRVHRAYDALDRAEKRGAAGDMAGAGAAGAEALRLAPGDGQVMVWQAIGMAGGGLIEPARGLLGAATAMNPRWPEFVRRLAASGAQPELVEPAQRLLGA